MVARRSRGFIYYVSLTGITGAKLTDMNGVRKNVEKIRKVTAVPVAVGFGVATPNDAEQVGAIADGVIVGTAIVRRIGDHQQDARMAEQVGQFVHSLKAALAHRAAAQPS
jgi:tryptophan synthase alpha chain